MWSLAKKVMTEACAIYSMAAEEMGKVMGVVDAKQVERQACWKWENVEEKEVEERMEWCPWGED